MQAIRVTAATMEQYRADCAADRRREREAAKVVRQKQLSEHDTEFAGKVLFVPRELLGFRLTKDDLRLLVVA